MPNQTLYDNFSQVRQYIDQEKPDLTSYVTKTELANCGYITSSDLPIIDESIVTKKKNNYTQGDAKNLYNATYTSNLYLNSNVGLTTDGIALFVTTAGNIKFSFDTNSFHPYESTYSGLLDLGASTRTWRSTYTKYLYLNENKVYIYSNGSGQMKFGVNGADRFRINYNTFEPSISGTTNLGGGKSNPFTNAYFTNLYTNNVYISNSTYLPKNTYWYDGSSYHWLGILFN